MNLHLFSTKRFLPVAMMAVLASSMAFAEKPEWAGQGKGGKHEQKARGGERGNNGDDRSGPVGKAGKGAPQAKPAQVDVKVGGYFGDHQRVVVREYYGKQYSAGRCPPGLAKKNNGCMPPGQAKKWAIGQPLPRDVVFYPVPNAVVVQLGAPPSGYKYVRVASDILLIAIGSSMIVDAIQDLGRM